MMFYYNINYCKKYNNMIISDEKNNININYVNTEENKYFLGTIYSQIFLMAANF